MNILAVINTHNRLALLQECVHAVRTQTHPVSGILVINNGSTDGTAEWLQQQADIKSITQPNKGGSFGFCTGIREAYAQGPDWIWLMDDDTVPTPTALEALVAQLDSLGDEAEHFGFLSSKVIWVDGEEHSKNRVPLLKQQPSINNGQLQLAKSGTFVSLFLSRKAIEQTGLPLKDFFIWFDDVEYTERIRLNGLKGGYVPTSVVVHKTPDNLHNSMFTDDKNALWKYRYGIRNKLYMRKSKKGTFVYYMYLLKNLLWVPLQVATKRKSDRWAFIQTLWKGSLDSLKFQPKKEYVNIQDKSGLTAGRKREASI